MNILFNIIDLVIILCMVKGAIYMTVGEWFKNENNPSLPKSEYLYGTRHIVLLIITFLLCVGIYFIFRKKSEKTKNTLFNVFAYILLFFEVVTRIVNLIILKTYTLERVTQIILPMHICSVMVWVFIIGILSKKKILLNYSVICGLLATLAYLLYPAVGINQKYIAFTNLYSTFSHMLGFVLVISLMSLRRVSFKFKDIWQTYICFIIMFSYGALLNFVIFPGSDYMYMVNDPLELNLNFPYQILYVILIIIYSSIFYVVNNISDRLSNKFTK